MVEPSPSFGLAAYPYMTFPASGLKARNVIARVDASPRAKARAITLRAFSPSLFGLDVYHNLRGRQMGARTALSAGALIGEETRGQLSAFRFNFRGFRAINQHGRSAMLLSSRLETLLTMVCRTIVSKLIQSPPISVKSGILVKFGKTVREKRTALELSQEELAERAGVHRTYIGMIERAEKNITLENIEKIAKALKTPLDQLLRF